MGNEFDLTTRDVVQNYMSLMTTGRFAEAFAMFDRQGTYRVIGTTAFSGVFTAEDMVKAFTPLFERFTKPLKIELEQIIVDGDRAVALAEGHSAGKFGSYDQLYAFVFTVKKGTIVDILEFMDPMQIECGLFGRTLTEPLS